MLALQELLVCCMLFCIHETVCTHDSCAAPLAVFAKVCDVQYEVLKVIETHGASSCLLECSYDNTCAGYDFNYRACTLFKDEINPILNKRTILLRNNLVSPSYRICFPNTCFYGGRCNDNCDCECRPGITGQRCETNIDECASSPCLNGGSCHDKVNGYQCSCKNFTGLHCETECYYALGTEYMGTISKTKNGTECQRWDSQSPHTHTNNRISQFPDNSLQEAANYCRNPDEADAGPWCYTMDPNKKFEFCGITKCP